MIGREAETKALLAAAEAAESGFVAIYGRRRIGKTFLVRETFDGQFAFSHSGVENVGKTEQLRAFQCSLTVLRLRSEVAAGVPPARELVEVVQNETLFAIVGRIVGTVAEERVLDESGKVEPRRLDAIAFDEFRHGYYTMGEKAGQAWNAGAALAKAALSKA